MGTVLSSILVADPNTTLYFCSIMQAEQQKRVRWHKRGSEVKAELMRILELLYVPKVAPSSFIQPSNAIQPPADSRVSITLSAPEGAVFGCIWTSPKLDSDATAAAEAASNGDQVVPNTCSSTVVVGVAVGTHAATSAPAQQPQVTPTFSAAITTTTTNCPITLLDPDDPIVQQFTNAVIPNLQRMIKRTKHFARTGERVHIDLANVSDRPTVIITCESIKRMKRLVSRTECIDRRTFDVGYRKGGLKYIASPGDAPQSVDTGGGPASDSSHRPFRSGIPVVAYRGTQTLGTALVGGYIEADGRCYGLTVSHVLDDEETDGGQSRGTDDDPSETSSISSAATTGEPGSPQQPSMDSVNLSEILALVETSDNDRRNSWCVPYASGDRLSTPVNNNGKGCEASIPFIMDWALLGVPLEDLGGAMPNCFVSRIGENAYSYHTITSTGTPAGRDVLIIVNGTVHCEGKTSGAPSLLSLRNGPDLGLAFMVTTSRQLDRGMSGAWVVDSSTSELLGHLYAVSTSSPWAYFIPIVETFKDIMNTLATTSLKLLPDHQGRDIGRMPFERSIAKPIDEHPQQETTIPADEILRISEERTLELGLSPLFMAVKFAAETEQPINYEIGGHRQTWARLILLLIVKLAFDVTAGVATAAAGARFTGNRVESQVLLGGLLFGIARWMWVDLVIDILMFKPYRRFPDRRWYNLMHLGLLALSSLLHPLLGYRMFSGAAERGRVSSLALIAAGGGLLGGALPYLGLAVGIMFDPKRHTLVIAPSLHSALWGEALAAVLFADVQQSRGQKICAPGDAAAAGAVFGALMLVKYVCCLQFSRLFDPRRQRIFGGNPEQRDLFMLLMNRYLFVGWRIEPARNSNREAQPPVGACEEHMKFHEMETLNQDRRRREWVVVSDDGNDGLVGL